MTTHLPTGDGESAAPAMIPDEAALTNMANDFYGVLPRHEVVGVVPSDSSTTRHVESQRDALVQPSFHGVHARSEPDTTSPSQRVASGLGPPSGLVSRASTLTTTVENDHSEVQSRLARPAPSRIPTEPLSATNVGAPSFYFLEERAPQLAEHAMFSRLAQAHGDAHPAFNVEAVRRDFPTLRERVHGHQLVWMDNGATTQKPQVVIDRLAYFYAHENSNIHRSAHTLAARASDAYEGARATVADFLGAPSPENIVFTRGTTESINLVAQAWGRAHVARGDEILISHLEHHANIVPWQQLAAETGAKLKVIPVDDDGRLLLDAYGDLLNDRTRIVAVTHVSNVTGTIVPVREVTAMAHRAGAKVLIDGAQAVAHAVFDVQTIGADFYVFSGHKVFGPTGIGALYATTEALYETPPWQGGGNMIADVTFERTIFQDPPTKFEAGTGNIADAVGLGTALEYLQRLGRPIVERYEHELLRYACGELRTVPGLRLIGTAPEKASVLTFVLAGYRPEEVASVLDTEGIAVRAGHHCAQPILRRFGVETAVRPSLALYNTYGEVDQLVTVLRRLAENAGARH